MVFQFRWAAVTLFILGFFIWAAPAQAQYTAQYKPLPPQTISCANVRCAGTCTDTPAGPVCGPRLSCANTLCAQGNQCIETQNGPQCVPHTQHEPRYYWADYRYRPYRQRPWRRYWRQNWQPPAYRPAYRPTYRYQTPWHGWGQYQPPRYQPAPPSEGTACPMVYDPVCGQKIVQCFQAPCPPLQKTFSNACMARAEGFGVLSKGECP